MSYNNDLTNLLSCVASSFGEETGKFVKAQVASALAMDDLDIEALRTKIAQIEALLSPNADSGQAAVVANLIAALTGLADRVSALENSTAVAELTAIVGSLGDSIAAEAGRAQAAEALLDAKLSQLTISLTEITTIVEAGIGGGSCDCAAIEAKLALHTSEISNLKAADASQEQRITDLQAVISELVAATSGIASAVASAAADAAAAAASAAAAAAAAEGATAAVNVAVLSHARDHAEHGLAIGGKVDKAEISAIRCADLVAAFKSGLTTGLSA